jgi:DNA polymerase-1
VLEPLPFQNIWCVDMEFGADPGERPAPHCLVAKELRSGRTIRAWFDELISGIPPYGIGSDDLFVGYYVSAELGCHLKWGWPTPGRVLDLFVEFRALTNGIPTPAGSGLLGALAYFGIDGIAAVEKEEMRELSIRGGPWTTAERSALLDYCESDVIALERLLAVMLPQIDLPRALLRGRYMAAAAHMEHAGVPIDVETLEKLRERWPDIQDQLIAEIDTDYGVYEGRTFKTAKFEAWLKAEGIPWPRLESGQLDLSRDAFREVARSSPRVAPLQQLRTSLSEMRLNDLAVGSDGRNRTLLSAFRSRTGRNQPSNSKYIFGPSVWLRTLIQPPPDHAVAELDWKQQEFGTAAALSGDKAMIDAYLSGDPYLAFAKQAGAVPEDGKEEDYAAERKLFKACVLAVQYGMGADALASRIGQPPIMARTLLRLHRKTYATFWKWSDNTLDYAMIHGELRTVFGWPVRVCRSAKFGRKKNRDSDEGGANPRSLRNFMMQAHGAEMLRLACCLATERCIQVCAPVHDAVLICSHLDTIDQDVERMLDAMREASRVVLGGFELNVDAEIIRYPDRYVDEDRGKAMWDRVMRLMAA